MILFTITALIFGAVTTGVVKVVAHHWACLGETDAVKHDSPLLLWVGKGVMVPLLVWLWFGFTINGGRLPRMPRLVALMLSLPDWLGAALQFALPAVLVIGSYWAALTSGWLVTHLFLQTEARREIRSTGLFWAVVLSPVALFLLLAGGWFMLGFAVFILLFPIARELTAFGAPKNLAPAYARAHEQLQRGNVTRAELEVIRQLERKEDDYDGWMMLAELYATKFNDLAQAEQTVREIGRHPKTTKDQWCRALHRLADWYLQVAKDPEKARQTLQEICTAYPHSPVADIARQRINQIPVPRTAPGTT